MDPESLELTPSTIPTAEPVGLPAPCETAVEAPTGDDAVGMPLELASVLIAALEVLERPAADNVAGKATGTFDSPCSE